MLKPGLYRIFEDKCINDPYGFLRSAGFTVHTSHRLLHNHVGSSSYRNLAQKLKELPLISSAESGTSR